MKKVDLIRQRFGLTVAFVVVLIVNVIAILTTREILPIVLLCVWIVLFSIFMYDIKESLKAENEKEKKK